MPILVRCLALIAPFLSVFTSTPHTLSPRFTSADGAILSAASLQLGHTRPASTIQWLDQQAGVAHASLGLDHATVNIQYKDGSAGAILPSAPRVLPLTQQKAHPHVLHNDVASGARALVLEPFAGQLFSDSPVGDPEVHALQEAGFDVDQFYDSDVTMSVMASLSRYSVVYMLTHSGVNTYGEGVIATGQVANGDPSVQPFLDDHTAMVVGVYGNTTKYYGVLSGYFRQHMGEFPPNSLVFIDGCSMLRGTLVWQALNWDGVDTMVSWDYEAMSNDDAVAAETFFDSMANGTSVIQAIRDVYNSGHGRSTVDGVVASFGYLGDPNLTLHDAFFPSTPTPTAIDTPAPTAISTPAPTSTIRIHRSWPGAAPLRTAVHNAFRT